MNTLSPYDLLIRKLDEFIRKYYRNQLLRGLIYSFAALLAFYLLVTILEYVGNFNTAARTFLFYSYIAATGFIVIRLIVIPLLHLYKLGKIISHEQASRIIGNHFSEVSDKLLNTLQLKKLENENPASLALVQAGINQKIEALRPIPFVAAIDLKKNLKLLRYAFIPLAVFLFLLFAAPAVITDATHRLVHHSTYFEKPAPFSFHIQNKELKALQQEDFLLQVKVEGKMLPSEVYVETGNNQFKMEKENNISYSYRFRNVMKQQEFRLLAEGYASGVFTLEVVPNPSVLAFHVQLNYPPYVHKTNESLSNTGDLLIPEGTQVTWNFRTRNAESLHINFADTLIELGPSGTDEFRLNRTLMNSTSYSITTRNQIMQGRDSMLFSIRVIPDLYPVITTESQQDSISDQRLYFKGTVKDDYGFSKLLFCYRFLNTGDSAHHNTSLEQQSLPINKSSDQDVFFHGWDLSSLNIRAGDELEYFFEVWDNDGVHGPKATRSQTALFKAPTLKELAENTEQRNSKLKDDLKESIEQAKKLQKDISDLTKKLQDKKNIDYDTRKKAEDLLKQQRELEQKARQLQQQNEQKVQRENEYKTQLQDIAEKQMQLQELFDRVMNEEMKKMLQEMEQMLSQLDKDKLREMMDKMKLDAKDFEKRLDRTLELFKQLEVEQKLKEAISNLEKLATEQNKLSEQSLDKNADAKDLQQKQNALNKEFEELARDLKDIEKKNSELEFPEELSNTENDQEEIRQDMQESEQQLEQNQKKNASQKQKSASGKMQQMAMKMQQQQQQQEMEQQEEDMNALRALLENLLRFSFEQESVMQDLKNIDVNNPQFTKLAQRQRKLKDDSKLLEDSLLALSKRVIQIQSTVNEQMTLINSNMSKSIDQLQDRLVPQARSSQQYVMTSVNNLALMLSEALQQMQQQMMQMKSSSSCKKPGKGKPSSAAQLRQMQEKLNEQLRQMKGKTEGPGKPGDRPGQSMSEEFARMAAQQEAIRNELQKLNNEENKDGKGSLGNLDKMAKDMEQTEKDLVNKRLSEETLRRQQDILTRLLESEKAERQREQDQKRQSNEGRDEPRPDNARFEEYRKLKLREMELLKTIPPALSPFYKNLVNSYFQGLENNQP